MPPTKDYYQTLLEGQVHLGQSRRNLHPKMRKYVYGFRHNNVIFDLHKTIVALRMTWQILDTLKKKKGEIIVITEDPVYGRILHPLLPQDSSLFLLEETPLPGFLTNWDELLEYAWKIQNGEETLGVSKKRIQRFHKRFKPFLLMIRKNLEERKRKGISLTRDYRDRNLPDLLVFLQVKNSYRLLEESKKMKIPTIAFLNSDEDPSLVTYPVPLNNRSYQSLYLSSLVLASALRGNIARDEGIAPEEDKEIR